VQGVISGIATIDYPYGNNFVASVPANVMQTACKHLIYDKNDYRKTFEAFNLFLNAIVDKNLCKQIKYEVVGEYFDNDGHVGTDMVAWNYQACTEFILEP